MVLTLGGWAFGMVKVKSAKDALTEQEAAYAKLAPKEKEVIQNKGNKIDIENKLESLLQLATNRFAWGPVLNAFQLSSMDNIQLIGLKGQQSYVVTPAVEPRKGTPEKRKPGFATENVVLTVEGRDIGPRAEASYTKYKETLANAPFFIKEHFSKEKGWRFKGIPEEVPNAVQFKLEGTYPEKVRNE